MLAPRDSRSRDCRRLDGLWAVPVRQRGRGARPGRWVAGTAAGTRGRWPSRPATTTLVTEAGGARARRRRVVPAATSRGARHVAGPPHRAALRCGHTSRHRLGPGTPRVAEHAGGYTPFEGRGDRPWSAGGETPAGDGAGRQRAQPGHDPARCGVPQRGPGQAKTALLSTISSSTTRGCTARRGSTPPRGATSPTWPSPPCTIPGTAAGQVTYHARRGRERPDVGAAPGLGRGTWWPGASGPERASWPVPRAPPRGALATRNLYRSWTRGPRRPTSTPCRWVSGPSGVGRDPAACSTGAPVRLRGFGMHEDGRAARQGPRRREDGA